MKSRRILDVCASGGLVAPAKKLPKHKHSASHSTEVCSAHIEKSANRRIQELPLERYISKRGFFTRRESLQLIRENRVSLGTQIIHNPNWGVEPRCICIRVDGRALPAATPGYWMLNKVAGEPAPKTLRGVLEDGSILKACGLLDLNTAGLILYTNSNQFLHWLTSTRTVRQLQHVFEIESAFRSDVDAANFVAAVARLGALRGESARVSSHESASSNQRGSVSVDHGRGRELVRVFEDFGIRVTKLRRVALGPARLDGLRPGEMRALTSRELQALHPLYLQATGESLLEPPK